jgi:hypothetical protein
MDTLEDLKDKAEEQLSSMRKAEMNAQHNYDMLKQSLEDQVAADNKDLSEQKSLKASTEEAKATAGSDLSMTVKSLTDGKAALETVKGDCMTTAADHAATVAGRTEELKVIADAKKLLKDSTSGASAQTYSFLQVEGTSKAHLARVEVVTLLKHLAKEQHSAALAQLASRVAAVVRFGEASGEDPFAKVKGLITDMISKLQAQAGSEATEKSFCDEQLAKTEEKKGDLEHDLSKLTSKIDKNAAASASLKEDVKHLQAELAALAQSQAEMDKVRIESHAAYVEAKADLESGMQGVRKALSVLRDYYGSAAESAALLQDGTDQPSATELHEKASGAGKSIIDILEVVESDFAKNLAKEETEEDDSQTEYEKTTQVNKVTRTMKDQDEKYATQEYISRDKSIAELSGDKETSSTELSAVLEYYAKIKNRCIAKPETYAERSRRRQEEVAGLKEALAILEDETAFTQKRKRAFSGHFLGMRA